MFNPFFVTSIHTKPRAYSYVPHTTHLESFDRPHPTTSLFDVLITKMSTHNKLSNGTNTANRPKRTQPDVFKVSDIVSSRIRELIPPERQKVLFRFQGNLRTYLSLQSQASGKKTKLSNIISFTSRHIGPDALAAPASTYVENTWGTDGTKILRLVDDAIRTDQVRQVGDSKPRCVNEDYMP